MPGAGQNRLHAGIGIFFVLLGLPKIRIGLHQRWRNLGRTSVLIMVTTVICVCLLIIDNLPENNLEQGESWEGAQVPFRPENKADSPDKSINNIKADNEKDDNSLYKNEAVLTQKRPLTWLEMVEELRADWVIGGENILAVLPGQRGSLNEVERQEDINDVSRYGEGALVDELLKHRVGGFFIESGAGDGRTLSSTLFLEQNRGWTGVLLEPDSDTFKTLNEFSARKAARLQVCLSPNGRAERLSYVGDLEGIDVPGERHLEAYIPWVTPHDSVLNMPHEGYNVSIKCFPLPGILLALRKLRVDFWVLDAGAAEVDILATAMLDTFIYDVIAVNIWAGSVDETLQKVEQVKKGFSGRPYHPVRILPKNWQKLQSAMLIIQRRGPQYPVTPPSWPYGTAMAVNTTTTSSTNITAKSDLVNIQKWLHWPKTRKSPSSSKSTKSRKRMDPQIVQSKGRSPNDTHADRRQLFSSDTPAQTVMKHLSFRENYWRLLRSLLPDQSPGFFLETNAAEGQLVSTTLHLEKELKWTGLLLEPDPDLFQLLLGRGRQCAALNMCLNVGRGHQLGRRSFRHHTNLTPGGRTVNMPSATCSGIEDDIVCATCVSLAALPAALNQSIIDFISLQLDDLSLESILQMDLQALGAKLISIEYVPNAQAAGKMDDEGKPALLMAFEKQLVKQHYVQAGSVTDDRHLMTTALLYKRRDPSANPFFN